MDGQTWLITYPSTSVTRQYTFKIVDGGALQASMPGANTPILLGVVPSDDPVMFPAGEGNNYNIFSIAHLFNLTFRFNTVHSWAITGRAQIPLTISSLAAAYPFSHNNL